MFTRYFFTVLFSFACIPAIAQLCQGSLGDPLINISFGSGTNYTAGLPVVRTSPDHGTGYDIAGKDKADESSFRQAVYTAIDIYNSRIQHAEISQKPLKIKEKQI